MTKAVLKIIANAMNEMGINYGFMEYNVKPIQYPYFVGEYAETAPITEDGLTDTTFTLMGYSRSTYEELENKKELIQQYFDAVSGMTVIAENGNGVAIAYENANPIPTWDEELKKIQIVLHIKEWSVI